ncbi:DNA phosphorothioation system restriction enzyme [Legionella massiliensis]|uniref:DNA phosphorothioation system restriction enzyme n=1 Tax=Legionella massiliensis TaxID=1034943 RepID=A0A078KWB3_9GAMM|nr:DEAD/DEAH box helicase [Legionella massiliensis]CDZ77292.1 DNA phosphorothioation system restriction enzyme [Legionella massiliensis]CEE13030.1 Ankyrin repeats (3 copies) [Legionella massiliensis]
MNYFETIYALAITKKKDELIAYVKEQHVSIDVFKKSENISVAELLAFEGRQSELNLLLLLGADKNLAIRGAARAGNGALTNWLMIFKNADIRYAAQGAAQGHNPRYALSMQNQGADINLIAIGAIQGKNYDIAEEMLVKSADINRMAEAAASFGDWIYIDYLRPKGASLDSIAKGAANGGFISEAESYRLEGANIDDIAKGAARGGHFDYAGTLIEQGASLKSVVEGAEEAGYWFMVLKWKSLINYFDTIYNLAKEGKKEELKKLLSSPFISVDVRKVGSDLTPAELLAFENEQAAVNLLISFGANVDLIGRGAARAGNINFCELLRRDYEADINIIAIGAAEHLKPSYRQLLQAEGASISSLAEGAAAQADWELTSKLNLQGADIRAVARGALRGQHLEFVKSLYSKNLLSIGFLTFNTAATGFHEYAEEINREGGQSNNLARGLAVGGYLDKIEQWINDGADINQVAEAVALSGNLYFAERLRRKGANINHIARGAVEGGHLKYAEFLRSEGAAVTWIAPAAAEGGNYAYAEKLQGLGANPNGIAIGASTGGRRAYAEKLRQQGADRAMMAMGAIRGGFWEYAEFLRTQNPPIKLQRLADHAAFTGYREYAELLRAKGADIDLMALNAAKGGNLHYSEYLRSSGANINSIIKGAQQGGYTQYVTFLRELPKNSETQVKLIVSPVTAAFASKNQTANYKGKESQEQSLKRLGNATNLEEPLSSTTKRRKKSEQTSITGKEPWKKNALISGKYSREYKAIPKTPFFSVGSKRNTYYISKFNFQILLSCRQPKGLERTTHEIAIGKSKFRLSTLKDSLPSNDETVTFIFAGRKEQAMIPDPTILGARQRLLVVVGADEYKELHENNYNENVEFLITDSLESATHGTYHPEDIQARRLTAFILSYAWRLKDCIYLDDNITLIQAATEFTPINNWEETTASLMKARDNEQALMCGMQTLSNKPYYYVEPDYCYKLFVVDFEQTAKVLKLMSAEDVFVLGYPSIYSGYCMQDFYFQMVIDFALFDAYSKTQADNIELPKRLLHLPPTESISLLRAKRNKNAAKSFARGLIEDIQEIDEVSFVPDGVKEEHAQWMLSSLGHLKEEIQRCLNMAKRKRLQITNYDYRDIIFQSNNQRDLPDEDTDLKESQEVEPEQHGPVEAKQKLKRGANACNSSFIAQFWTGCKLNELIPTDKLADYLQLKEIVEYLYPYQADALRAVSKSQEFHSVVRLNTGGGKTLLGILLANFLIMQDSDAVIHIIVPTVQLANQYYVEFIRTLKILGKASAIEEKNVITVHSRENAVTADFINTNNPLREKASVFIFCDASYSKVLAEKVECLEKHRKPRLVILDEFHLYKKKALHLMQSGMSVLGFSATPGNDIQPLFVFTRADSRKAGKTAPLIIDRVSYSFNKEMNHKKHEQIVKSIWDHIHPMGKPLVYYKGIIYTSSIEEAKQLAAAINQEQAEREKAASGDAEQKKKPKLAQAIHSQIKDYEKWIEQFKRKSLETSAILVVVDMLGTGYDDPDVVWGLYAKNKGSNVGDHSQKVGRTVRINPRYPNKIAYFLADNDVIMDLDEVYKDEDALFNAADKYYDVNRQLIYLELMDAIDRKRPFHHYAPMFKFNKLDEKYSLSKNLILVLKALESKNEEWSKGLLELNGDLKKLSQDRRGREFNLLEVFINEVIGLQEGLQDGLKQSLFTLKIFDQLIHSLNKYQPALLNQLIMKPGLGEMLKRVDEQYTHILHKYGILRSEKTASGFWMRNDLKIGTSSSSFSNRYAFVNNLNIRISNELEQRNPKAPTARETLSLL